MRVIAFILASALASPPPDSLEEAAAQLEKLGRSIASHRLPTPGEVNRLEARLVREACIGGLERWDRVYAFALDEARLGVDGDRIDFALREAGRYEFRARRRIVSTDDDAIIHFPDDRPYRIATGTYDVPADRLILTSCGDNAVE